MKMHVIINMTCRGLSRFSPLLLLLLPGHSAPHAVFSMAAKNKHRKRPKAAQKGAFWKKESEEEPEINGNEEDADPAADETEETTEADGEELSLEEVLRLGGTKVGVPT